MDLKGTVFQTPLSQQFTLWNQMGSQVDREKMIMLPIGEAIVYVQPVYLKAAVGVTILQLQRLILSKGELVVMEPSLQDGLEALNKRLKTIAARERRIKSPPREAGPGAPPVTRLSIPAP
ncbi:MAG: hypothetical protein PHW74_11075 [Desulfobacca sp.]|nr:hypothetical protein [Desulfobacca sp.]